MSRDRSNINESPAKENIEERLEQRLEDLTKRLQRLTEVINAVPSIVISIDKHHKINLWNEEARKFTGIAPEDAVGKPVEDMIPLLENERAWISQALDQTKVAIRERVHSQECKDRKYFDVMVCPLPEEGAVIRVADVTDKVNKEELVVQSEKMLSVGGLAAGLAHEINNPLAGMLHNMEVVSRRLSPHLEKNRTVAAQSGTTMDAIVRYVERRGMMEQFSAIQKSGMRAAKIVDKMLSFSRASATGKDLCNPALLLDNTVESIRQDCYLDQEIIFDGIEIVKDYGEGLPPIPCSAPQIQQVILSLLVNAAQAIPQKADRDAPPRIVLRARVEESWLRIEVEDNGPGMEESVRKRVFEPFFSTRTDGASTGLGLAVAYFIITNIHRGAIVAKSSPGQGSLFVIHLPLHVAEPAAPKPAPLE